MATSCLQKNTILKKGFAVAWVACIALITLKMFLNPDGHHCCQQRLKEMSNYLLTANINVKTVFIKSLHWHSFRKWHKVCINTFRKNLTYEKNYRDDVKCNYRT